MRALDTPLQFRARHPDRAPLLTDGHAARALKVLVDAPIWERLQASKKVPEVVLRELLGGERIEMSLYGDDGPPSDAPRRPEDSSWGGGEAVGWTVVTPSGDPVVPHEITTATATSVISGALFADQVLVAGMVLTEEQGSDDGRDALLIAVAQEMDADLLITERRALLSTRLLESGNCQVAGPEDALALVALYLRSAGKFILTKVPNVENVASPTRFYQEAAEVLIPSLEAFAHRADARISAARVLTVISRVRTLLKARDRIALLTSESVSDDVADEISVTFTHALVDMVALHDVLARIVNEFLEPPEPRRQVIKWSSPMWRERVMKRFPEIAGSWGDDGVAKHLNDALRTIRNEIHDVAPVIIPYRSERGATQVGLSFHVDVGTPVVTSLQQLADSRQSGIHQAFADGHLVDPHLFCEFVLPWLFRSVDDILRALLTALPERPAAVPRESLIRREVVRESVLAIARLTAPPSATTD